MAEKLIITKGGKVLDLAGKPLKVGQKAPDFKLVGSDKKVITLADGRGKVRVLSVVYSLDTSVCDLQTQQFEEMAAKFKDVVFYTVSMDLPVAQSRYTKNHQNKFIQALSDHMNASFGAAYGLLIKSERMLARAVFIIDKDDVVRYAEYVKDVGQLPDFDGAVEVLKKLAPAEPEAAVSR